MKKIVLLDTSYPINNRNTKILLSLSGFERFVITWNRDNRMVAANENWTEFFYTAAVPYGDLFGKLMKMFSYSSYIKKRLNQIKPDCIIASHWPMLVTAALIKPKGVKLVYENLDIPTAGSGIVLHILRLIERMALKKADCILLASRFYKDLYSFYRRPVHVIENKPFRTALTDKAARFFHDSDRLKISFIGTLRYFDCMRNLIIAVDNLPIDVLFFGEGRDYQLLYDFSKEYANVYFFGQYDYEDIKCIYDLSDIVWAVYPNKDYNVKYAISNKFFESLVFEKPAVFADGTELGRFVVDQNIGFAVDPYKTDAIRNYFLKILNDKNILPDKIADIKKYNSLNSLYWDDYIQSLNELFSK
ncbi:MAG: hypothetical protein FWE49_00785 [Synergistaceae bacterium]|nr:hypothetical protein [Synergistaceae bacterium]